MRYVVEVESQIVVVEASDPRAAAAAAVERLGRTVARCKVVPFREVVGAILGAVPVHHVEIERVS